MKSDSDTSAAAEVTKGRKAPSAGVRSLSTAEERREELISAAIPVFAEKGYHAAPTTEIAKRAGISQAYLFRLFPTKEELFVAAVHRSNRRMLETLVEAAERAVKDGVEPGDAMGLAYGDLVGSDRQLLLVQLHAQAVSPSMPAVREAMRESFADLYAFAAERTGGSPDDLKNWFAHGMLINVMTALSAEEVNAPWAIALTDFEGDCFPRES
jgi:AcrR family transcriptional regulator